MARKASKSAYSRNFKDELIFEYRRLNKLNRVSMQKVYYSALVFSLSRGFRDKHNWQEAGV